MESISENRPFFYSIVVSCCAVVALITRLVPDLCEQFEVVPIPYEVISVPNFLQLVFCGDMLHILTTFLF